MEDNVFAAKEENERGEQTTACCVQEVVPFGGNSVRVWEEICGQERTPLVIISGNLTAHCYIDDILHPTVLPVLQQQPHGVIYQQTPYSQRIVQNFLGANINMLAIVFCMLARQVPNTTPMRWHGSSCSTTSIHSSQPTRTDSGPPKKLVMNPKKKNYVYWCKWWSRTLLIWFVIELESFSVCSTCFSWRWTFDFCDMPK